MHPSTLLQLAEQRTDDRLRAAAARRLARRAAMIPPPPSMVVRPAATAASGPTAIPVTGTASRLASCAPQGC